MLIPMVIVDVEATCDVDMPIRKRELIEIGAVKVLNGKIIDKFQIIIKPKKNSVLTEYCKELTHISQEQIENGYPPKEALHKFATWCGDCIIASWGEFDKGIIEREMHKNKVSKSGLLLFVNLRRIYFSIMRLPSDMSLAAVLYQESIKAVGEPHRAYNDAYNTYLVYKRHKQIMDNRMKQLYPIQTIEDRRKK